MELLCEIERDFAPLPANEDTQCTWFDTCIARPRPSLLTLTSLLLSLSIGREAMVRVTYSPLSDLMGRLFQNNAIPFKLILRECDCL
jgi:hypothetical protein